MGKREKERDASNANKEIDIVVTNEERRKGKERERGKKWRKTKFLNQSISQTERAIVSKKCLWTLSTEWRCADVEKREKKRRREEEMLLEENRFSERVKETLNLKRKRERVCL
jgi:hypothetical protein